MHSKGIVYEAVAKLEGAHSEVFTSCRLIVCYCCGRVVARGHASSRLVNYPGERASFGCAGDSREPQFSFGSLCFSSLILVALVDDDARYWLAILFLLGRIDAMCSRVNCKAVNQLLNGKVFNLPKEVRAVFLHDRDGAT